MDEALALATGGGIATVLKTCDLRLARLTPSEVIKWTVCGEGHPWRPSPLRLGNLTPTEGDERKHIQPQKTKYPSDLHRILIISSQVLYISHV
jgi:hypothetical protein